MLATSARPLVTGFRTSPFVPLLAAVASLPMVAGSGFLTTLMTQAMTMAAFALSFNFLLGHAGLLSFGHAIYFGFGAYATVHALNAVSGPLTSSPLGPLVVALSPLVGAAAAAGVALGLGWLTSRRAGTVFAMITLGLGELIHQAALMSPDFFGGEGGVTSNRVLGVSLAGVDWASPLQMYLLATAWCLICWGGVRWLLATPFGALCMALRDNPQRLQALGFVPSQLRYRASVAAAAVAGAAGSLSALTLEFATPEAFSASQSASVLIAAYIGGIGHPFGPVVGGLVYTVFAVGVSKVSEAWHLYLGAVFIATVMALPGGLTSLSWAGISGHRRHRLGLLGAALLLVAVLVTIVELVYRWRLGAGGEPLQLGPLALRADDPGLWMLLIAAVALTTWLLIRWRLPR